MNTLLDPLKAIARDLVEKKLWPIAVLLLAAIVAVPIVLGGSSSEQAPVAVAATAPDAAGSKSLVIAVDQAATGKDSRPGPIKDPFFDPPQPAAAAGASGASAAASAASGASPTASAASGASPTASAASGASPAASGGTSNGGGTPAADTPPGQTTAPPQTTPRQPVEPVYHRTVARWHAAGPGRPRQLTRLTPFGDPAAPVALYLGVTKSGASYAVFLLSPHATSDGDAECDEADCRVIGLKAGQSQIVTMQPPDGADARRYRLEVVSVRAVATDPAKAREMRAKVHADGRDVMRAMWQHRPTAEALQPIRYDLATGLLFKTAAAAQKASK